MEVLRRREAQRPQDVNTLVAIRSASDAVGLNIAKGADTLLQLQQACAGVLNMRLHQRKLHGIGLPACA